MSIDLITRLIEAGTPAALVAEVAAALARADAVAEATIAAALEPTPGAIRMRRYRVRQSASQNVTCDAGDAQVTESVTPPPALDKEIPPRPPKENNPSPRVGRALVRKAAGFGPPDAVELQRWNEFCAQRKKALTPRAYELIVEKLTEGQQVGWPPGDLIDRAIGSGWETVFIPKEDRNGRANGSVGVGGSGQSRSRDGFLNAINDAAGRC